MDIAARRKHTPVKVMVIKAVIQSKMFSSRLHLMDSKDLGTSDQELDSKKVKKSGIRVANWFQRKFGKSTKVQIGNKIYHLNTKSLNKYIIRAAGLSSLQSTDKAVQRAAMGAFAKISSANILAKNTPARNGLLLLQHAQMMQLRDRDPDGLETSTNLHIPSIGQFVIDGKTTSKPDVWVDFFGKEVETFESIKSEELAAVKAKKADATLMQKFENTLDQLIASESHMHYHFTGEKRSRILAFVASLSDEHIAALTNQIASSIQIIQETKSFVDLKISEKKLAKEKEFLETELITFARRQTARELDEAIYQGICNVVFRSSDSATPVIALAEIPESSIVSLDRINPSLAAKLRAYNRSVEKLKKAHKDNERLCDSYEKDLVGHGRLHAHYAEYETTLKEHFNAGSDIKIKTAGLSFDGFVAQYGSMGIDRLSAEVSRLESEIEHQNIFIKSPEAQDHIETTNASISELQEQVRVLKASYSKDHIRRVLAEIDEELGILKDQKNKALIAQAKQKGSSLSSLKNINDRIADLESRRRLYTIKDKERAVAEIKTRIQAFKEELQLHQHNKDIEVKERKAKLSLYKNILKSLKSLLTSKEKAFAADAKKFAQKEGLKLKAGSERSVLEYIRDKLSTASSTILELTRSKELLRKDQEEAQSAFIVTSRDLLAKVNEVRPMLLTDELRDEIALKHLKVRQELDTVREEILTLSLNEDLRHLISSKLGESASIDEAYAYAKRAQIINRNFLYLAVDAQEKSECELFAVKAKTDKEIEQLEKKLSKIGATYNLKSDLAQALVFEGAKKSIASKIVGARTSEQQAKYIKARFDVFIRDNTPRMKTGSFSYSDVDSAIFSDSMHSFSETDSLTSFSELSLGSISSTFDSESSTLDSPSSVRKEATMANPIFQRLWLEAANKSALGVSSPGQQFIGELDGFDAKYFAHPDEERRLSRGKHLPLLTEETAAILEVFVNGHEITGVHFNYKVMSEFIRKRDFAIASTIKDENLKMTQKEKSLFIVGSILVKGLEKSPEKVRAFKKALTAFLPDYKDFLVDRKLISA
ncbi:MAG: hypothetical protein S4CHLAM6_08420 [Chlamydiae bacterium]|nr:hypothetical protein [Chlamydiota bacterium]